MRWTLAAVAGFARRNGIPDREVAVAAALAWETSGGDDFHQDAAQLDGQPAYFGLWGVPASDRDGFDRGTLLAPNQNARAAAVMFEEAGRSWSWSPVYAAGLWRFWEEEAVRAASSPDATQRAATVPSQPDPASTLSRVAASLRGGAEQLTLLGRMAEERQPRKG